MKVRVKRLMALVLSFALVVAVPFAASTQKASAASGSKIKQPVQITRTYQDSDGTTTSTTTYVYDKNGLNTEIVYQSDGKDTFAYNKKGLVKSWKYISKTGEVTYFGTNTIKKGKIASSVTYEKEDGKDVLSGTTKYTYKKGKKATQTYTNAKGTATEVTTFRPNGKKKKYVYTYTYSDGTKEVETSVYDKKGNITSNVYTDSDGTSKTTYKNTYKKGKLVKTVATRTNNKGVVTPGYTTVYSYKKGKVVKSVATRNSTYTYTDEKGAPVTYTDTSTYTTTYAYSGSLPSKITETYVYVDGYDKSTTTEKTTTVIKYKKIKVNNKAKKAVKEAVKEFGERYLPF